MNCRVQLLMGVLPKVLPTMNTKSIKGISEYRHRSCGLAKNYAFNYEKLTTTFRTPTFSRKNHLNKRNSFLFFEAPTRSRSQHVCYTEQKKMVKNCYKLIQNTECQFLYDW